MNDTEKERPSKMDVQNRPQNSFLLSDQEPRQNRAQSSNHGRQGESSCFIPKVIPDAYEGNVSNTLKNHRDVRKGSEEAPQRQSSNQGTGHTERDYTASKYSTAGSQSQESSSSSRPRRVDNGYSGSVSNMPTGTSKFSQSLSQLSSQAGSLSRTRYEPQVQGGFSSGQDYQNYRFKDRQDYDRPSSGSHVISSIPEKKAMEDRKSVAEPLRILTDEDFHKKLQEDEAKRREETRRKNEEERLRRKKIQEERQREIEELRRQEQEIDEESTRNLAEFEENQAKEKIREEERRKKEEEETAKKNRLEEEERRKAEKSYDLMMAQVKRNMFVESKWDQWFGQLRGSVSHLISSLENVIFYVKTTDWKKAEVHLLSYNQEKILSVTGECKKLLANYQDQIDMIARLILRSEAPFLKDVKDNLERLSTLVRQLSGRLLLQEIDKIEFNTEEWTDIENLTKEVEKTARDIPSTYTLKQKYKNYTEKSKKPMKELRAISD
ncbi:unnamed protein product [Caenorhabditis auriculariae]|uniref:Uncharacterized protein n=1 Tax=Caenorhabditis auriculariae TaxID=2777116 RepID=A0A8S1HXZ7_9PELO|nr:unnamed protein product [Caenorhabditis auriculariae]